MAYDTLDIQDATLASEIFTQIDHRLYLIGVGSPVDENNDATVIGRYVGQRYFDVLEKMNWYVQETDGTLSGTVWYIGADSRNISTLINQLTDHVLDTSNPHQVTPEQIGGIRNTYGSITDLLIGNRTVNQTLTPTGNSADLTTLLSGIVNRLTTITGESSWLNMPKINLDEVLTHTLNFNNPHNVSAIQLGAIRNISDSVTDSNIGQRSISDTATTFENSASLTQHLSSLATQVKRIIGLNSWGSAPEISLSNLLSHTEENNPHNTTFLDVGAIPNIANSVTNAHIGNRTIDQSVVPTGNLGDLSYLLNSFANRLKSITGSTNWYDTPSVNLTSLLSSQSLTISPSTLISNDTGTALTILSSLANRIAAILGSSNWKDSPAVSLNNALSKSNGVLSGTLNANSNNIVGIKSSRFVEYTVPLSGSSILIDANNGEYQVITFSGGNYALSFTFSGITTPFLLKLRAVTNSATTTSLVGLGKWVYGSQTYLHTSGGYDSLLKIYWTGSAIAYCHMQWNART